MTTVARFEINSMQPHIGSKWRWFIALGVVLVIVGALAFFNLPAATTASVYLIGIFMFIGALAQLGTAFAVLSWSGFALLLLSGILYAAAAVLAIANPMLAAVALTLMLGFALMFSGVMRIWSSAVLRPLPGRGWMAASGAVSILAGIVLIRAWPADALWLLGMVLAVDLTFQGAAAIAVGLAMRQTTK